MKKSDLKTGMRVKTRSGKIYLVIKDIDSMLYGHQDIAFINSNSFSCGGNYMEDLKYNSDSSYDIVEVFQIHDDPKALLNDKFLDLDKRLSIWKREEYTDEQKEVFKALKVLGFNWIARDDNGNMLMAYDEKPIKAGRYWGVNLGEYACDIAYDFDFIKWEDKEPFEIPELEVMLWR
jgi:hypothetical protein